MKNETEPEPELLNCKELAGKLRKHISFVYAMRQKGFSMPAGLVTLIEARAWLAKYGSPKSRKSTIAVKRG